MQADLILPARGRKARLVAVGWGVIAFFWLSLEDNTTEPVVLLGLGLAALSVVLWLMDRFGGRPLAARHLVTGGLVSGAVVGLGTGLATVVLMFFKNARHAHVYPDFPPELMGAVLQRVPVWTLAGALAGLGLGLAWLALRSR